MTEPSVPSNTGSIDAAKRVGHVKRYMFGWAGNVKDGDLVMHERPDGMWVKYDDMVDEIERLNTELRLAISARDYANDMLGKARGAPETEAPQNCPDCGMAPAVDGMFHKQGCPQL